MPPTRSKAYELPELARDAKGQHVANLLASCHCESRDGDALALGDRPARTDPHRRRTGLPADVTVEELCDWDRCRARIAALPPWWEPGGKTGYHACTFGYIVGEIVRRAGGRSVDGVELIFADRLREATAVAFAGTDQLFGSPVSRSLGFTLGGLDGNGPSRFGWGGVGGSYAFGDTATGLAFALRKNRLTPDFAAAERVCALVLEEIGR